MKLSPVLRVLDLFMIALLVSVVIWTFKVKHDSEVALDRVAKLERDIEAEEIEIDLLQSDWGLLTSPARLEILVKRYGEQLGLQPTTPAQLANTNSLPPLKQEFDPFADPADPDYANTDSSVTTGSISGTSQDEVR
ncbi:MAG: hypothetical protein QNJ29_11150 [Rhizobiaceae bacterium]|nr:hypothetical protein [Rhizobiaceae bacterium]